MKILLLFLLAGTFWVYPAFAAPLPEYNIAYFCNQLGELAEVIKGNREKIIQNCMQEERAALQRLQKKKISRQELQDCDEWIEDGGESYKSLEQCLKEQ